VTAREHPPAIIVRQQRHDLGILVEFMRDLNTRQSQLFFLIAAFIARYRPSELESIVDEDVVEAAGSLASTFETAVRGVIYEHRTTSIPAARLATSLRAALAEASAGAGTPFERDAAVILRRLEQAARRIHDVDTTRSRAFIGLLERVVQPTDEALPEPDSEPRLIVP
jgi:hypothetical protein